MRKTLGLLLVLSLSDTAHAEFTDAEKFQVNQCFYSLRLVTHVQSQAIRQMGSSPADVAAIRAFVHELAGAWRIHQRGCLYLLDQNGGDNVNNGKEFLATKDRTATVDRAIELISGARGDYSRAIALAEAIPGNSGNLLNIRRNLADAARRRAAFDTSLTYLEPLLDVNLFDKNGVPLEGVTRARSGAIHPHGNYRMLGESMNRFGRQNANEWRALADAMNACPGWTGSIGGPDTAGHTQKVAFGMGDALMMSVGVFPDSSWKNDVDIMHAGAGTTRGIEFQFLLIAEESLLHWTHQGPDAFDVNGRHVRRGLAYDLSVILSHYGGSLAAWNRTDPDRSKHFIEIAPACGLGDDKAAFLLALGKASASAGMQWAWLDNFVAAGIFAFRHFQVTAPPPPRDPGDPPPPDPEPPVVCGLGTFLDDTVEPPQCLPIPPEPCEECETCPEMQTVWQYLPTGPVAQCVAVQ